MSNSGQIYPVGNGGFTIPTDVRTVAKPSDRFIGIDDTTGLLYTIAKSDLFAGLSGGGNVTEPAFTSVVLLLHFDGEDNSTIFTDVKNHTINIFGNPKILTLRSVFGGSSLYLDGNSSLNITKDASLTFGSADLTWECWIYPTTAPSSANTMAIMGNAVGFVGGNGGLFMALHAGKLIFRHWLNGNTNATSTTDLSVNTWYHIAAVKHGTALNIFVNGVIGTAGSTDASNTDNLFSLGNVPNNSGYATNFTGYIDECRVTNGTAIYTSNFTVPNTPFTNS